jgi:outer membrane receptor protein involved in Fe transport
MLVWSAAVLATPSLAWAIEAPSGRADLDEVVVTANRREQAAEDVPSSIEVVTAEALENTVGVSFTDLLKKNAGVDVIQYPNGLAGVGLRGFRPDFEFSINPRTLTLVDGRPSGSTSFTTIAPESIERVEVLKGPASSLYGASAIGGVVNIITRRSSGPLEGRVGVGYGSFGTYRAEASAGGSLGDGADFDLGVGYVNQSDDFEIGGGVERPNSDHERLSGRLRVGSNATSRLRIDASIDGARLSNNASGAFSFVPPTTNGTELERYGGDFRAALDLDAHQLALTVYGSNDAYDFVTVPAAGARYRSSRTESTYRGLLLQDAWTVVPALTLTFGLDWQTVEIERFAYLASGAARAPFSPNERRETQALYAEAVFKTLDDRLVLTAGARQDWITSETLATPLLTTFRPGESEFEVFSPRGGVVFKLSERWRLHATAGAGFAPPQANQIAGVSEELAGTQRRLTFGNPDLKPEENTTYDLGVGYASPLVQADVTYFDSRTTDRITTVIRTNTPSLRETTYVNANKAAMRGLEAQLWIDAGRALGDVPDRFSVQASLTHMLEAEELIANVSTPIRNVADWKAVVSATASNGRDLSLTLTARYNGQRWDADNSSGLIFTSGRGGVFEYPTFTVFDASLRWSVTPRDVIRVEGANLFDKRYFEKADYPMPGRAFYVRYQRSL